MSQCSYPFDGMVGEEGEIWSLLEQRENRNMPFFFPIRCAIVSLGSDFHCEMTKHINAF